MRRSKLQTLLEERGGPKDEPEQLSDFFGPNWKTLLNFWLYLDDISEDSYNTALGRYNGIPMALWITSYNRNELSTKNRIGSRNYHLMNSPIASIYYKHGPGLVMTATAEIIVMDFILSDEKRTFMGITCFDEQVTI